VVNLQNVVIGLGLLITFIAASCGGQRPADSPEKNATAVSALVDPNDRTHTGRAAYYNARVARLREIAQRDRQLAQAYARWTPRRDQAGKVNVNTALKVAVEARAMDADRTAAEIQELAEFHRAEAAKEVAR
jgi:hypothetical protein